jgi:hypothetical protein
MTPFLSKSDFKVARTCATKLYYRKLGYPSNRDDDEYLRFLADGGYMVEAIAKLCYPDGIEVDFDKGAEYSAEETLRLLSAHEAVTLFEATLLFNKRLARIDILRKTGQTFELIEVKAKLVDTSMGVNPFRGARGGIRSDWQPYLEDVSFQFSVLRQLFPSATVVPYLCLVDKAKTTGINSLFAKFELSASSLETTRFRRPTVAYTGDADELRRDNFLTHRNVGAEVAELLPEVEHSTEIFLESLKEGVRKIPVAISIDCRTCEYRLAAEDPGTGRTAQNGFVECWGDLANEDPHILDYYHVGGIGGRNSPVVNALLGRRRAKLSDVAEADLVRADGEIGSIAARQRLQRECTLAGREHLSPDLVRQVCNLAYPLHFIDFETSRVAVPYHAGMRPYENVAFQWSCHTIREKGGPLEHSEWINVADAFPNFAFAEALMKQLGESGSFLTWSHHENTVLKDIHDQMHRYRYVKPHLDRWLALVVSERTYKSPVMVDMCELAKTGYFHPKMKGRLSLKYVLPAVWEANDALHNLPEFATYYRRDDRGRLLNPYDTLPSLPFGNPDEDESEQVVSEGTGAMRAYQEMLYGVSRHDAVVKEQWRRLLLQYCKLDSAAMVMVWHHWHSWRCLRADDQ